MLTIQHVALSSKIWISIKITDYQEVTLWCIMASWTIHENNLELMLTLICSVGLLDFFHWEIYVWKVWAEIAPPKPLGLSILMSQCLKLHKCQFNLFSRLKTHTYLTKFWWETSSTRTPVVRCGNRVNGTEFSSIINWSSCYQSALLIGRN